MKERIFTKPITVDGVKKECFLRPCESVDYLICRNGTRDIANAPDPSMDVYYENIATIACGGKHLLFGDETISSELEERIRAGSEDVISEFDPKHVSEKDVEELHLIAEILQYKQNDLTKEGAMMRRRDLSADSLSIDRFITRYICYMPFNLGMESFGTTMNKFLVEKDLLEELKQSHEQN